VLATDKFNSREPSRRSKQMEVLRKVDASPTRALLKSSRERPNFTVHVGNSSAREKAMLPAADYFTTSEFEVQRKPPEMVRL
jgi:hypothetical protein